AVRRVSGRGWRKPPAAVAPAAAQRRPQETEADPYGGQMLAGLEGEEGECLRPASTAGWFVTHSLPVGMTPCPATCCPRIPPALTTRATCGMCCSMAGIS